MTENWKRAIQSKLENWASWAWRVDMPNLGWPKETVLYRVARYQGQMISGSGLKKEDSDKEAEEIDRAIRRLSNDKMQEVIVLRYLYNLPHEMIGEVLNCSTSGVKNLENIALSWLHGFLAIK